MIVSRCCKDHVYVRDVNESAHYVCKNCDKACDTVSVLEFTCFKEEIHAEV